MANGGFFIVNMFNMLSPTGWSVQTPPELRPGGWASLDLLSAPFITSLFATLTQSQSTWRSAAATAGNYVSALNVTTPEGSMPGEKPIPGNGGLDDDTARAICTVVLITMFSGRAVKNFGGLPALRRLFGKLSVWTTHRATGYSDAPISRHWGIQDQDPINTSPRAASFSYHPPLLFPTFYFSCYDTLDALLRINSNTTTAEFRRVSRDEN